MTPAPICVTSNIYHVYISGHRHTPAGPVVDGGACGRLNDWLAAEGVTPTHQPRVERGRGVWLFQEADRERVEAYLRREGLLPAAK